MEPAPSLSDAALMSQHSRAIAASGEAVAESRLLLLWSARVSGSRAELERWAHEQLPALRSARGVHGVSLCRVAPASPRWAVDWDWAFELRVSGESVDELCDRGACGDLMADMRLLGMRPAALLLEGEPA
jgi:hypothetical protein